MVAIIDYGMGNLRSVQKAVEHLGMTAVITGDVPTIDAASHVILPGVGAFGDAMARLQETGMDNVVKRLAAQGKPLLGICLGMQLFFASSTEHGEHEGLGLIPSAIVHFPADGGVKVPHMGWNNVRVKRDCPLFSGSAKEPYVYFVHSYYAPEISEEWTVATCEYGVTFTAAVQRGNVFGTQYHPEKSGDAGLAMLQGFLRYKEGTVC